MPTYHANGLAWSYSDRCGECLDDFAIDRDECDPIALAEYDAMTQGERDRLDEDAEREAWREDYEDAKLEAGLARRCYCE